MIRVLVVEDHTFVRQSLVLLLSGEEDLTVVGATGRGDEAIALAASQRPDVVLLDIGLPDRDGLEVGAAIRRRDPGMALVYLSMYDDDATLRATQRLRAEGFVLKTEAIEEVCLAVRQAAGQVDRRQGGEPGRPVTAHAPVPMPPPTSERQQHASDLELVQFPLADVLRDRETAARTGFDVSPARLVELANAAESLERAQQRLREPFDKLTAGEGDVLRAVIEGQCAQAIARDRHVSVTTVRSQIRAVLQRLGVNSQLEAVALARRADWPAADPAQRRPLASQMPRDDRP